MQNGYGENDIGDDDDDGDDVAAIAANNFHSDLRL